MWIKFANVYVAWPQFKYISDSGPHPEVTLARFKKIRIDDGLHHFIKNKQTSELSHFRLSNEDKAALEL